MTDDNIPLELGLMEQIRSSNQTNYDSLCYLELKLLMFDLTSNQFDPPDDYILYWSKFKKNKGYYEDTIGSLLTSNDEANWMIAIEMMKLKDRDDND